MLSRLLARLISGNLSAYPKAVDARKGRSTLTGAIHRLWVKLFCKDAHAPKFHFHRVSLVWSLLVTISVVCLAGFSYWYHTGKLPRVLLNRAETAKREGDFRNEIEWRRRYLLIASDDIQTQGKLALALDSLVRSEKIDDGSRGTFEAMRQLEIAENLGEELDDEVNRELNNRLAKRYLEASEILAVASSRQDDEPMEDSLLGEAIGYLTKAMLKLDEGDQPEDSIETALAIQKLALRRAILEESIHSLAIYNMRFDSSNTQKIRTHSNGRSSAYFKRQSLWFDDALRNVVTANQQDESFLNFLLSYRDNEVFPWNEANQDGWQSQVWKDLPQLISNAVRRLDTYQGKLLSLRLDTLIGENSKETLDELWANAADELCSGDDSQYEEKQTDGGIQTASIKKNLDSRDEFRTKEHQAALEIIYNAWQRYPIDQLDEKSIWWAKMCMFAENDQSEVLANLFVVRARRHIANDELDKGVGYLQQAIDLQDVTPLNAYQLLAEINLNRAMLSEDQPESKNKQFVSSLDQYLAAIGTQTQDLEQSDLPETDRFLRSRRRILLAHRSNHEVMDLSYRWIRTRKTPSLDRFNKLMIEGVWLGIPEAFDRLQVDRVAEILQLASDNYATASLFEDAHARHPKNPTLRNRCFDIWFKIGNFERAAMYLSTASSLTDIHGQTRLLFMRAMQVLRDPENAESIATLREDAEILQLNLLEQDNLGVNQRENEVTQRVLKYVQVVMPDDDTPVREYVGSPLMRERVFEFASSEPSSAWVSGLVFGLLQYEKPENRKRWLERLPDLTESDGFSTLMNQARAYEAMGRYWAAIRLLLNTDGFPTSQEGLAKTYAADLAEIAAGHVAKREVLLSIPGEDRTPQQWFQICFTELKMILSARELAMPALAESARHQFDQHRASLIDIDGHDSKFVFLINTWFDFELAAKEYRSGITRHEELKRLESDLDKLLEQKPWWTPLLTLRGMVAAELNDSATAIDHLSLAVRSGDGSIVTKRELINQLERTGDKQQAQKFRQLLRESLSRQETIWASYREENPQLQNRNARLRHHQNLAMSHDVSQAWLMWAGSLIDACRQSINRDLYRQFIRQAEYCLTRVEMLGDDKTLPVFKVRHQFALIRNRRLDALKIEEEINELAKTDANAFDALIACVLARGETKKAVDMLLVLNEREPTEARMIKQAQCQSGIGLTEQAEASLKKAAELFPQSNFVRDTLARWIAVKKDPRDAKNQLRELLLTESAGPQSKTDQLTYVQLINNLDEKGETDQESIDLLLKLAKTDGFYAELAGHAALRVTTRSVVRNRSDQVHTVSWLAERLDDCFNTLVNRQWITANDLAAYGTAVASLSPRPAQSKMDGVLDRVANLGDARLKLTLELEWWKNHKTIPELAEIIDRWKQTVISNESVPEPIANCLACTDYLKIGDLEAALAIFSKAFSDNPRSMETYLRLLTEAGQADHLVTFAEKAIQLSTEDKQYSIIALNGIRFFLELTDDSVLNVSDQLIGLSPNSLAILDFASQLHFIRGQHAKAAVFLSKMNEIQPDKAMVLNNLAMCLIEIPEEATRAIEVANNALRLAPHDASIMDTLAVALLRDGQPDKAVTQLESAIAIRKEPRFLFHLLLAYEQLGRQEKYEEAYSLLSQIELDVSGLSRSEREIYEKKFL